MARARIAALAAVVLILALGATAVAAPTALERGGASAQAVVAWPASAGLLVAEVVTGGASASDEYVELTNAASSPVDLAGLEVAYVTSSGSTVTRKASWATSLLVGPGRHLLIANGSGIYAGGADATYSGGFAATGGAIVLRPVGGQPIDAAGWGDATSAFVEGTPAPAPAAGNSIERRPGGAAGSSVDTNDNVADFILNATPVAQGLASAPGPTPSSSASPSASSSTPPSPTASQSAPPASPSPSPTVVPTPVVTATPAPTPTATPTPILTVAPTATPTAAPTATPSPAETATPTLAPTPTAPPSPTPTASPTAQPVDLLSIESVRGLPDGAGATIEGVLTTDLGSLEGARSGFVQDATGGIAVYLDAAFDVPTRAGWRIRASGVVDTRFSQRTLRVDRDQLVVLGEQWLPTPLEVLTGAASEPLEGLRLQLTGTVTEAPSALSDGLGVMIDDGSGEIRVIAGAAALGDAAPVRGSIIVALGPLGQRDSSGTGLGGYRLHATLADELTVFPPPSPTPTPTVTPTSLPTPTVAPTPSASASPSPTAPPTETPEPTAVVSPSPTPSPVASDAPLTVAAARATAIGNVVLVRGVVVAEPGRLGSPPLLGIADQTGGVAVKLPDGIPGPARGTLVELRGTVADPYGQVEIRPGGGDFTSIGTGTMPTPIARPAGSIGEGDEGRLVRVAGTIDASAGKSTSNDVSFSITGTDGGTLRILADASSGLEAGLFRRGATVTLTGVIGQRASRKGASDGYRLWLRDRADVVITAQPAPNATPRGGATPTPRPGGGSAKPGTISIRNALLRDGQHVAVEGTVTVGTGLLDSSGRRTIVEDDTAAIEVYLAAPDVTLKPGARVRVTGTVGEAWGAPRLRADGTRVVGSRRPIVHAIRSAPTAAVEWRLVRVSGSIIEVHRNGDRWTADLRVGAARVLISGLAGSGIAATDLVEGRSASITGIVKRPYPTATDRRFAIVPRQRADIALGRAVPTAAASPFGPGSIPAPGSSDPAGGVLGPDAAIAGLDTPVATDIDLADLAAHAGERVRVGGLVTAIESDGVRLDDGTAEARLVLEGEAAGLVGTLVVGDALNATGRPELREEPVLVVETQDGIELVGDLGAASPADEAASADAAAAGAVEAPTEPMRAVAAPGLGLDSFSTGIGTLVLLAISTVGVALARRQRAQRLFRARIVTRLEAIGRGAPAPNAGPVPGPERPLSAPIGAGTGVELGGNVRGSA
jgi:hypothetical protein